MNTSVNKDQNYKPYGYYQEKSREMFTRDDDHSVAFFGLEEIGIGMAHGENNLVIDQLKNNNNIKFEQISLDDLFEDRVFELIENDCMIFINHRTWIIDLFEYSDDEVRSCEKNENISLHIKPTSDNDNSLHLLNKHTGQKIEVVETKSNNFDEQFVLFAPMNSLNIEYSPVPEEDPRFCHQEYILDKKIYIKIEDWASDENFKDQKETSVGLKILYAPKVSVVNDIGLRIFYL